MVDNAPVKSGASPYPEPVYTGWSSAHWDATCQLPWQTKNNWVVGDHIYFTQQQVNYNKRHKHNIKTNIKTRQINTKKKIFKPNPDPFYKILTI